MLGQKSLIVQQVVHKFAASVQHDQKRVDYVYLNDWFIALHWQLVVFTLLAFDRMQRDYTIAQHSRPVLIHADRLNGAEVVAFADETHSIALLWLLKWQIAPSVVPDRRIHSHSKVTRAEVHEAWLDFKLHLRNNHVVL